MRIQFMTWGWKTHFYPMVPLAWALRTAGHEVRVLSTPGLVPEIQRAGLVAVPVGADVDPTARRAGRHLVRPDGQPLEWADLRRYGGWTVAPYLRMAEAMLADSIRFTRRFAPDLIVFEATTYAGPLTAARVGIPAVRHCWGVDYSYQFVEFEQEVMAPHRASLELDTVETLGARSIDPCPRSMQIGPTPWVDVPVDRLWMRYVPYNGPGSAPRWLARPRNRPRICVTWGYVVDQFYPGASGMGEVLAAVAGLDVEVVATVGRATRERLGAVPDGVRLVESLPLHLLLPTCDLLISQGGQGTMMTGVSCGVPQLVLPPVPDQVLNARQLAATGAGRFAFLEGMGRPELRSLVVEVLHNRGVRAAAGALAAELAAQPSPGEVARTLVELVSAGALRHPPGSSPPGSATAGSPPPG